MQAGHTDTPVPWHQDAAYWTDMTDKRAVSCWVRRCVAQWIDTHREI